MASLTFRDIVDYAPSPPVISFDGVSVLNRGELLLVKGRTGVGKSRFAQNLAYGLGTGCDNIGSFTYTMQKKVGFFSTELSMTQIKDRWMPFLLKIGESKFNSTYKLQNEPPFYLDRKVLVTEESKQTFKNNLCKLFKNFEAIVIDHILDCVDSINLEDISKFLMEVISTVARETNTCVVMIIHQNDSTTIDGKKLSGGKAKGQVGSFGENKADLILEIVKKKDKFETVCTKVRTNSVDDFRFSMNKDVALNVFGPHVELKLAVSFDKKEAAIPMTLPLIFGQGYTKLELLNLYNHGRKKPVTSASFAKIVTLWVNESVLLKEGGAASLRYYLPIKNDTDGLS